MPQKSRSLTVADIAHLQALLGASRDPMTVYRAVEAVAAETVGFVFLTTLKSNEGENCVERVHSSDESAYPLGGRKALDRTTDHYARLNRGEAVLLPDRATIQSQFADYALIFSLGSTAILNAPIRFGGLRIGTLNFCGIEGQYGAAEVETANLLAGLLAPCLLADIHGWSAP